MYIDFLHEVTSCLVDRLCQRGVGAEAVRGSMTSVAMPCRGRTHQPGSGEGGGSANRPWWLVACSNATRMLVGLGVGGGLAVGVGLLGFGFGVGLGLRGGEAAPA